MKNFIKNNWLKLSSIFIGIFLLLPVFASAIFYVRTYVDSDGNYLGEERINDPLSNFPSGGIIVIRPQESESDKLLKEIQEYNEKLNQDLKDAQNRSRQADLQNTSSCYYPVSIGCTTEAEYGSKKAMCSYAGMGASMCGLDECRKQIDEYTSKKQAYDKCIKDWQEQMINEAVDKQIQAENQRRQNNLDKLNLLCFNNYGSSHWDDATKSCKCNNLRWMIGGKCQLDLLVCINLLGNHSIPSTTEEGSCLCETGYEMKKISDNKFSCEKIVSDIEECSSLLGSNAVASKNADGILNCNCKNGYKIKVDKSSAICEKIETPVSAPTIKPNKVAESAKQPTKITGVNQSEPKAEVKPEEKPIIQSQPVKQAEQPAKKSFFSNLFNSASNLFKKLFKF